MLAPLRHAAHAYAMMMLDERATRCRLHAIRYAADTTYCCLLMMRPRHAVDAYHFHHTICYYFA